MKVDKNKLQNYALLLSDNSFVKMSVNPHYPQIMFSTEFLKLVFPLLLLVLLILPLIPLMLDFHLAFGTLIHIAFKMF